MKKHILCFGDSNTHGYCADPSDSADGELGRFNEEERWTCLLQQHLGDEYLVIEEGLSGRTTVFDDPLHEGLSGIDYLSPCLRSHSPIDLLIIMLGTNDTKERFSANAYAIGKGMERLILSAKNTDCWAKSEPNILVVCPPPIGEGLLSSPVVFEMGEGSVEKSRELAAFYGMACWTLGAHFLDAGEAGVTFNEIDFMHLTKASNVKLTEVLSKLIPTLL